MTNTCLMVRVVHVLLSCKFICQFNAKFLLFYYSCIMVNRFFVCERDFDFVQMKMVVYVCQFEYHLYIKFACTLNLLVQEHLLYMKIACTLNLLVQEHLLYRKIACTLNLLVQEHLLYMKIACTLNLLVHVLVFVSH